MGNNVSTCLLPLLTTRSTHLQPLLACSGGLVSSDWANMDWAKIGFLVGNTTAYPTGLGLVPWYLPDFTTSKIPGHACSHCKLGTHGHQSVGSLAALISSCHHLNAHRSCLNMVCTISQLLAFPVGPAGATTVVSSNGTTSAGSTGTGRTGTGRSSNSTSEKSSPTSSAASAAVLSISALASLMAVIASLC